ncbi:MAG: prolyl oligopeptidase family serine peptidase [Candidatus Eisenbacteria bacterium]
MPGRIRAEDIYKMSLPGECVLSPDGSWAAVVVMQNDSEKLKRRSQIWMVPTGAAAGAGAGVGAGARAAARARESAGLSPARAARRAGAPRPFTSGSGMDTSPRFSPDGKSLAFLSDRSGKTEIWIVPTDGGEARQLTKLGGGISWLQFHPDGRSLVFVFSSPDPEAKEREERKKRGEPGQDAPRVRVIDRLLYKVDGGGFLPPGRPHVWTVEVASGKTHQLTRDDRYAENIPVFSPDGRWIYFNSNRTADPDMDFERSQIWRMPARGGPIERVRLLDGYCGEFSLSPDGERIAFMGREDPSLAWDLRFVKLWVAPATGGRPVPLTDSLDRLCDRSVIGDCFGALGILPPVWSPDGRWIYFLVSNEGNDELWRVNVRDRKPARVIDHKGAILHFDIDWRHPAVYATFAGPSTVGELYRIVPPPPGRSPARRRRAAAASGAGAEETGAAPQEGSVFEPLTRWSAWMRARTIALPEELWFRGRGGAKLQGWVLLPDRAAGGRSGAGLARRAAGGRKAGATARTPGKIPGVLYIHGGPATQYGNIFFHEFQFLAGLGYAVFYCNPRGGTGYSEKHLAAIHDDWGRLDYSDLMDFTDEVLARYPQIDRRRLAVCGGSYGGYMTNWILGHTDRFAAAVTQRSVTNLMSFAGTSDFGYHWHRIFGGRPAWSDPAHWLAMSPIAYADAMKTPTLIEHQERDDRCPIEQAEQLYAALRSRGVPVEFHRYPEESHGMSRDGRPDRRIERLRRIAAWLDRWIGSKAGKRGAAGRSGRRGAAWRRPARRR